MARKAKFTDFIPMQEELRALKTENERLKKLLSDQEKEMDEWVEAKSAEIEASFDAGHFRAMSEHTTPWKIRAEAAERALAERAGGVKVKPLEWEAIDGANAFRAPALIFGWIRIETYTLHNWQVQWSVPGICNLLMPNVFKSPDEAKAAAQADYESRILSALTTEPAAPEGRREEVDAVIISARKLAREYRPSMDKEVLHSWASDAVKVIRVLSTRPSEQAVTEAGAEVAARLITKWLGFAWDGLHDGRVVEKGFEVFTHGQFGWRFQGHKGDMIDLARAALKAAMEAGR